MLKNESKSTSVTDCEVRVQLYGRFDDIAKKSNELHAESEQDEVRRISQIICVAKTQLFIAPPLCYTRNYALFCFAYGREVLRNQ